MKRKIFLCSILCVICASIFSQVTVSKYMNDNRDAVVYHLPKKSFVVEIIYSERQSVPGAYSKYASEMLGIDNVIKNEKTEYIIEGIKLHPFNAPDENARFTLKAPESSKVEKEMYVMMNNLGIFCGLTSQKDVESDFADINFGSMMNSKTMPEFNNFSAVASQFTAIDTVVRMVSFDTSFYKMEVYNPKTKSKTVQEKASDAVAKLMDVRQHRMELLTGYHETAYDAASLKYMETRLLEIENAYLSLFCGYTNVKYYKHCFTFSPDANNLNKDVNILCFTKDAGVCTTARQGGQYITANVAPHSELFKIQAPDDSRGIRYRVPVLADIQIKYENKVLTGGVYTLPQLGNIISLDAQKYKQLTVDPETGNIKSVKVE